LDNISKILNKALETSENVESTSKAIVMLYKMFEADLSTDKKFQMFISPFIDIYESSVNPEVRNSALKSLYHMNIVHDNVLSIMIVALNDVSADVQYSVILIKKLGDGRFITIWYNR
jgi:hypothetical protein